MSYRLGHGEVTPAKGREAMARTWFLVALDEEAPECRADLVKLHERWSGRVPDPALYSYPGNPLRGELQSWARRWSLTHGQDGEPAEWVLRTAALSLWQWETVKGRYWVFPSYGYTVPDGEIGGGRYQYDPYREKARDAKRRVPKRYQSDIDRITAAAIEDGGVETESRRELDPFRWVVLQQVLSMTLNEVSDLLRARGQHVTVDVLRQALKKVKPLLNLKAPLGRPARFTAK